MSDSSQSTTQPSSPLANNSSTSDQVRSIYLVSYPKVVFLYPTFITSLVAAIYMSFAGQPLTPDNTHALIVTWVFLGVLTVNLMVFSFDFPRTTSLTLFFFAAVVVMGGVLLFQFRPDVIPVVAQAIGRLTPLANATFYYLFTAVLGGILLCVLISTRFDYWEVRPNELLHHHGVWSNMKRFPAPHLRIDKEINDVFEYMLLRSGRLILHPRNEPRAIVLENVLFIARKEEEVTRLLGALQVQVRSS